MLASRKAIGTSALAMSAPPREWQSFRVRGQRGSLSVYSNDKRTKARKKARERTPAITKSRLSSFIHFTVSSCR
jgi:hypothetical protein